MVISAAKIIESRSHIVPGKLKITEWFFEVPRIYDSPKSGTLRLFARSARKHAVPVAPGADEEKKNQPPWLLYLQGGPGFECSPPQTCPWTKSYLDKGYQMLYLDQRGTGLSTPVSAAVLGGRGDDPVQAQYLQAFRADNIVRDCEAVRQALTEHYPEDEKQWSVHGQSFGGFCAATYLSFFPQGLREVFLTGGLPPLVDDPDEVYTRLFRKVVARNESYYSKYPVDVNRVKDIVRMLSSRLVRLPSEGVLSASRFLQLGIGLGLHGGIDRLHNIVLRAWNEITTVAFITRQTLDMIEQAHSFDTNILYALLHEPIYCQDKASNWSAHRIMQKLPEFDHMARLEESSLPIYFTGEMIFPEMLKSFAELKKLDSVAQALAEHSNWPKLYDVDVLRKNKVPVYAAVYMDDMYVDFDLAMETARAINGCKTYITNSLYHDALRSKEEEVFGHLWNLREDVLD